MIELLSSHKTIYIRKYCNCIESTIEIYQNINRRLIQKFNYFKNYNCNCRFNNPKKVNKYCPDCEIFLCDDCSTKHKHSKLIENDFLLTNCRIHLKEKLIGFCKTCKKSICQKCIINILHKNHKIILTKDLKVTNEILDIYKNNLFNAVKKFEKLINLK